MSRRRWAVALASLLLAGTAGTSGAAGAGIRPVPVQAVIEVSPVSPDDAWAFLDPALSGLLRLALQQYPEVEVVEASPAVAVGRSREGGGVSGAGGAAPYRLRMRYVTVGGAVQLTLQVETGEGENVAGLGPVRATPGGLWHALERLAWELQATLLRRHSSAIGRRVAVTCFDPRIGTKRESSLAHELPFDVLAELQPTRLYLPLPWEESRRFCPEMGEGERPAADLLVSGVVQKHRRRIEARPYVEIVKTGQRLELAEFTAGVGDLSSLSRSLAGEIRGALDALIQEDGSLDTALFEESHWDADTFTRRALEVVDEHPYVAGLWASRAVEKAALRKDEESARLVWARALTDQRRYADALDALELRHGETTDVASLMGARGRLRLVLQEGEEAESDLRQALSLEPGDAGWTWSLGVALQIQGREEEALEEFRHALELAGDDSGTIAVARRSMAQVYGLRGDWEAAWAALEPAVDLPSVASDAGLVLLQQAREQIDGGDFAAAEATARHAYELRPDGWSLAWLTRALLEEEKFQETSDLTAAYFEQAAESADRRLEAALWNNRGYALHRLKRYPESLAAFEKARQYGSDPGVIYTNLAALYMEMDRVPEALQQANRLVELRPEDPDALALLAHLTIAREDFDLALEVCDRLLAIDDTRADVHWFRGVSLLWLRRFEEAVEPLRRAVELSPDNAGIELSLSIVLGELGDLDGGREHAERALELDAGLATTTGQLANLSFLGGDPATGEELVNRALELNPDDPWTHFVRARHEAADGRFEASLDALARARKKRTRYELWVAEDPGFAGLRQALESGRLQEAVTRR